MALMRAVITGQVGLDKKPFLTKVVELASQAGHNVSLCNVGDMMYAETPDVTPGRILDLPLSRLTAIRRSVFKDISNTCETSANVIINTHATFRWRHGLFYSFDHDQMQAINADIYIVLLDNIDQVHLRMVRDGHLNHTLKDLMVWREEEILATELLSQIVSGHGCFYIMALGNDQTNQEEMVRLLFDRHVKKAYLSFPMTHLKLDSMSDTATEIESFRSQMKRHFICFDPGDLEEKVICERALAAAENGQRTIPIGSPGSGATIETNQALDIISDIDGQIYARDFKLIDQSDMIISLIPELSNGQPGLSSGVERELQHAHEAAKDVFVIWQPKAEPSPFITETATRVFRSISEAAKYLAESFTPPPAGQLFA